MDEMASLWSYQENVDELKQKLLCTSIELEQLKMEANEELRKNKEYAKQLLQLLKMACQERDEARDQFQKLMNKVMYSSDFFNGIPCQIQPPESSPSPPPPPPPQLLNNPTTKGNSSITESNSHSENYNYHSHGGVGGGGGGSGSSPVDSSFFDPAAVSSSPPELMADSNINIAAASFVPPHSGIPKLDQGSLLIENLAKGKSLPQRGKFLKAVLDSGPLLQNLLVAGPLPRWRNPPQLQTFHIPPVSVSIKNSSPPPPDAAAANANATDINNINPRNFTNLNQFGSRFQNQTLIQTPSRPYTEMSCASSQMMSNSMLNFANVPTLSSSTSSGACMMMNSSDMNGYAALGKRQRLH